MDPVTAGLELAREIFKLINTERTRKYIDRSVDLELELQRELEKPYDKQDDQRIVSLRKERIIIISAAKDELKFLEAKK